MKIFLKKISLFGFGRVKLKYIFSDKIIFYLKKSFASKSYRCSYGELP